MDVSECVSKCVCVQAVQQDPRVTQLVKDLNTSIQAAAEQSDSGDSIPAVLILNKVSVMLLSHPLILFVVHVPTFGILFIINLWHHCCQFVSLMTTLAYCFVIVAA